MPRRSNSIFDEKDTEPETERSLFARITEGVIVFAVCAFLIKLGVSYIVSVRVPLIVIGAVVLAIYIVIRVHRWRRRDDY